MQKYFCHLFSLLCFFSSSFNSHGQFTLNCDSRITKTWIITVHLDKAHSTAGPWLLELLDVTIMLPKEYNIKLTNSKLRSGGKNVNQALYINTIAIIIDCTNIFPATKSNIFQDISQKHSKSYYFYILFQCETAHLSWRYRSRYTDNYNHNR